MYDDLKDFFNFCLFIDILLNKICLYFLFVFVFVTTSVHLQRLEEKEYPEILVKDITIKQQQNNKSIKLELMVSWRDFNCLV